MSPAEEIKAKLDIVEVIREYIQVKATGANFQALCPFHREKTPSFVISPDKQIWHCFGCGKGGDVLSFVQEIEGLSFPDTLRLLAPKAGVVLKAQSEQSSSRRGRILDCLKKATEIYQEFLEKDPQGLKMKKYLLGRGLSEETIKKWQIGYSPESWTAVLERLREYNFSEAELMAAGLLGRSERGRLYDRFRDRIVFPIRDVSSNVIAFTARINPDKAEQGAGAKYINSPQTDLYDKSRVLFALDQAKRAIKDRGFTIVVEGQMDAIACHQHAFSNTVASSGTALTELQLLLLKRFSNNLILSFDMDSAGQLAADRGIKEALRLDMNVKVIILPKQYKDPDECLRSNPEDFKQAVINAKPFLEYYFNKLKEGRDLRQVRDKKAIAQAMLDMIARLSNKIEQDYWLKRLAENLEISEAALRESLPQYQQQGGSLSKQSLEKTSAALSAAIPEQINRADRLSELLLAILLKAPDFILYCSSHLETEDLSGEKNQAFYKNLIIYYNKFAVLDYESFCLYLQEQQDSSADICARLALLGEKDYYNYDTTALKLELTKIILDLKKFSLKRKIKQLQDQLATAEAGGEEENLNLLLTEIKNLSDELNSLQSL
jgi:DNA primase